ncbi:MULTISPECIES: glycoside hydrolase family 6 protein [Microbacterium]|uniref:glycoside hydrolase family 6 protein n=1 Tax=Microbacterium TaxID=33882 RepID=UPI00249DC2AB|nr:MULTISPECIES: glycoside hydrolase family 6 protein [Microbacterium]WHE35789.1 glycoside hydrolase family 6 protein [Microbacterium sp. BDGP8]WRK16961.1 glycoside hydrolase family 6 protein [Microbacterium plantarum]
MAQRPGSDASHPDAGRDAGPYVVSGHYEAPPRPERPAPPRPPRRRRRLPRWAWIAIIVAAVALIVAGIALAVSLVMGGVQALTARPPGVGTAFVAPAESKAARAVAEGGSADEVAAARYLAAQPTAYWLTPEQDPIGEVGERVLNIAQEARETDTAMAVVVYGLPGRDCGNHSAGGLDEADYETWTTQIGTALRSVPDVKKVVIVEPDSLALAPQCGNVDERVDQLRGALGRLTGTDTWVYVDGGHSNWLGADAMAELVERVAVSGVRGFVTNVSNFNDTYDEFAYAHALSDRLGGMHALVDTSRNGAGAPGDDEWCNPPGRAVGDPSGTYGDDVVDTNLWIKPPGESDGPCNGGPDAGVWWPAGAVELTRGVAP